MTRDWPAVAKNTSRKWVWVLLAACTPLVALNVAVALCGRSVVFPLSPFFVREKMHALSVYFAHRGDCFWQGHPPLDELIGQTERRYKLPKHLLEALVTIESGKQVHRISSTGAMGPAQLMPATAADMHVVDPFDPQSNLNGGARYLAWLLKRYHKLPLALAAYNAGPGNVKDKVPNIGETQIYVRRVLGVYGDLNAASGTRIAAR